MRYRKRKFESFTKKELADRHKQLIGNWGTRTIIGFSEVDDNPKDEDFIPTTPAPQRSSKRKLFNIQEKQNNKRQKKEEGNQDNSSDENSVQDSEQGSTQEHSEMESDNDEARTSIKSGEKLPFGKYYKGDKGFYPGNSLNYSFPNTDDELKRKLEKKITSEKKEN